MSGPRRAVRVVLVDDADEVLLLWHDRPHDDPHWAPPGGGIDVEEDDEAAARRELLEETGLTDVDLGAPVWTWQHRFSYHGRLIDQHETVYVARVDRFAPAGAPAHLVADGIARWRWWSLDALAHCADDVWPHGIARLLPALLSSPTRPAHPVDLGFTGTSDGHAS